MRLLIVILNWPRSSYSLKNIKQRAVFKQFILRAFSEISKFLRFFCSNSKLISIKELSLDYRVFIARHKDEKESLPFTSLSLLTKTLVLMLSIILEHLLCTMLLWVLRKVTFKLYTLLALISISKIKMVILCST